jgi:hypothetical protein
VELQIVECRLQNDEVFGMAPQLLKSAFCTLRSAIRHSTRLSWRTRLNIQGDDPLPDVFDVPGDAEAGRSGMFYQRGIKGDFQFFW